jgi:3-deoxy-manno-octulosonate cytidylyltransferase (CMP-KDO synthetase)
MMPIKALGVIPARYGSSRFPGKPLCDIGGKSMLQRVYEQALKSSTLSKVVVATDDDRIFSHVKGFGGDVLMTSTAHNSGTSRLGEVAEKLAVQNGVEKYNVIVNIQGDEPFIDPSQIDIVVERFQEQGTQIATLISRIGQPEMLFNPNVVKVVVNQKGFAMYFSRSPIPFFRGAEMNDWPGKSLYYKHIGLYAYDLHTLLQIINLPPAPTETAESLEQLRWLFHGYNIATSITDIETVGIDTPEDLQKLIHII